MQVRFAQIAGYLPFAAFFSFSLISAFFFSILALDAAALSASRAFAIANAESSPL